jgi:VWFA-related protein
MRLRSLSTLSKRPSGKRFGIILTPVVLACMLVFSARNGVQAQDVAGESAFRVSVDRVQIGAVVTDSKGHHVTDLAIADFAVLDAKKRQQLTNCEYIRLAVPGQNPQANSRMQGSPAPPGTGSRELSREQVRRAVVFLVDDISFSPTSIPAVREAVRNTIQRSLQPGDMAALIRTSSGSGSLEQFTADTRVLLESAEKIRWRPESRGNPGMLQQTSGSVVGEKMGQYLVADSEMRTKAVLRYAISALRDLPGRKAIFLISQSLPIGVLYFDPRSGNSTELGELVDEALRAGVVVYSVDPTPLTSLTPDASYDVTREYTAQNGARGSIDHRAAVTLLTGYTSRAFALLDVYRAGLRALAEGTGGEFAADTDAGNALSRFTNDLQGYYLLTYRPAAPERYFALQHGDQPPFRSVSIRVSRAGLHVRAYAGYVAAPDPAKPAPTEHGEISEALFSPFSAAAIHVNLTSIFTVPRPASPELNLLLHIDSADLNFALDGEGRHNASFEVAARAAGEANELAQAVDKGVNLRLEESSFASAMRMGVSYRISVPARRAGLYDVRIAVRDKVTGKLGSAREFVATPDLKKGRLAASGVLLYNPSPREGDADAPGSADVRRFRAEDSIGYACQVFNGKSPDGEVRIARDGKSVFAAAAEIVSNGDGTKTARGMVRLSGMAPGFYVLQVVASEDSKKDVAPSPWIDFEIVR